MAAGLGHGQCYHRDEGGSGTWLPVLLSSCLKIPKVSKLLLPAYQLQFSSDSSSLFIASARGSVHVVLLLEPGGCRHLHTLRPPSGLGWGELVGLEGAGGRWAAVCLPCRAEGIPLFLLCGVCVLPPLPFVLLYR